MNVYGTPEGEMNSLLAAWDNGSVPMLSWLGYPPAQVISGQDDARITADALAVKEFVEGPGLAAGDYRRIYIRYQPEMNGNWETYSPCYNPGNTLPTDQPPTPQAFIQAWQRVHDIFASEGLNNSTTAWVFSANWNSSGSACDPASMYPGSSYVDWLGVDGYAPCATSGSPSQIFSPMVDELRAKDSTKPVGIDEAGVSSLVGTATKNQWITDYFSYLSSANLEMALWYNHSFGPTQAPNCNDPGAEEPWAIFSQVYPTNLTDPENGQPALPSYGDQSFDFSWRGAVPLKYLGFSAYNAGVQASSVIGGCSNTTTYCPRILTDQQFLGQ